MSRGMAKRLASMSFSMSTMKPIVGRLPTDEKARDRQRRNTTPWRAWYKTARWQRLRIATFTRDLFTCRMCRRLEGNTSKLVCDHVKPHRGNEALFWDEANLQALCKPCHDREKQAEERAAGWN
jgi:5-methylcytosine-specific restriction protein A